MTFKAGFVNILGNPNAGKSTLFNALIGEKMAIISPKAQTTRHRILGIINGENFQMVVSDTPGMVKPAYLLHEQMMRTIGEAYRDADVILLVIDAQRKLPEIEQLNKFIAFEGNKMIALNKIDLLKGQEALIQRVKEINQQIPNCQVIPISAKENFGIEFLQKELLGFLPESPAYFAEDQFTDRPLKFFMSEIIREQIFHYFEKEIPYSCEIEIEEFKDEKKIARIRAIIYVIRKSQKGIIIGHKGEKLKLIGTKARMEMEEFLNKKVFLEMYVKVKEDWRNDPKSLNQFGY